MLEAFIVAAVLCGFFGLVFKENLLMKIIAMDVMSTGVVAYYVLIASRSGVFTPILTDRPAANPARELGIAYADPVPQAVILTAIVIGFSIQALMLVGVMKLARNHPTLDSRDLEQSSRP